MKVAMTRGEMWCRWIPLPNSCPLENGAQSLDQRLLAILKVLKSMIQCSHSSRKKILKVQDTCGKPRNCASSFSMSFVSALRGRGCFKNLLSGWSFARMMVTDIAYQDDRSTARSALRLSLGLEEQRAAERLRKEEAILIS